MNFVSNMFNGIAQGVREVHSSSYTDDRELDIESVIDQNIRATIDEKMMESAREYGLQDTARAATALSSVALSLRDAASESSRLVGTVVGMVQQIDAGQLTQEEMRNEMERQFSPTQNAVANQLQDHPVGHGNFD
ncbi:MAG: hypothetical protein EOP45_00200 [Sphingobacteriaceae bacterium]|nr:MAG: hypothetical protein EOP45_00200 [Sphingobacteriaceae bacterium]